MHDTLLEEQHQVEEQTGTQLFNGNAETKTEKNTLTGIAPQSWIRQLLYRLRSIFPQRKAV